MAAGDIDQVREMANDVLTVAPDNDEALDLIRRADSRQRPRLGERTVVTVLFSDLVDSTPMAEVEEPEIVRDVFALYREEATRAVDRFGGRIVNYLGDGVVATFGYPEVHEDDARRAINAGLELVGGMQRVARQARERHGVDARVRVGIHTGLVVVADIGAGRAVEHDAMVGVTPNLAARIQAAAAPGQVIISDVTHHIVEADFDLRSLGAHHLKGIARDVELFAVDGKRHVSERLAAPRFAEAPMIGRDDAMAKLRSTWLEAADGKAPAGTLILGQAGLGKSRLVAEFRSYVETAGGEVFVLGCLPYYTSSPLWPAAQSLLKYVGITPEDNDNARVARLRQGLAALGIPIDPNLALLAPLVGVDIVGGHEAPELDPVALHRAVMAALLGLISTLRQTTPLAVIVEDVHWADPSTLDLAGMLGAAELPGVMLLMTSRTPLSASWASMLTTLELTHLADPEAEALVGHLVSGSYLDDAVRDEIVSRAGGVPLFVEELTRSALGAGAEVPLHIQELLTARLRVPGLDMALAQTAATLGVEFDGSVLESIVEDSSDLELRLRALQDAGIIDPVEDPSDLRFRFRHALLRDAAYETQVLDTRRERHGKIAGALSTIGGDPAVIARHFDLAGAVGDAIAQYGTAVQAAQAAGAHVEAIQLATRALELITKLPDGPQRDFAELGTLMLRGLSVSSIRGYAAPEVEADFRRADELSEALGTAPEVMPAAIAIWSYSLVNGDVPTAALLAQRLRARVEDGSATWFAPEVDACLGFQALYESDLPLAAETFARAEFGFGARPPESKVSEYWPLPNDPIAVSRVGRAVVATLMGDLAAGAAFADAALARAAEVTFPKGPFSLAFVKVYLAWLALLVGDLGTSQRLGEETIAIGQQHGYAYWMALGAIYHRAAAPDAADFEQAMTTLRAIGHEAFRGSYMAYLASLQRNEGNRHQALQTVHDAILEIDKSGEMLHRADLLRMRGELTIETGGDPHEGRADIEQSLRLAIESRNVIYGLRAALTLARLPDDLRASDWEATLRRQTDAFHRDARFADLDEARGLLH